jgi:ectoine hydroxylase-related dioxygenase (phytanoyl-CoA dioxygenase family)
MAGMTMTDALDALGASGSLLTEAERHALDEDGFVMFKELFTTETAERLRRRLDELIAEAEADPEAAASRPVGRVELLDGVIIMQDLVAAGTEFHDVMFHPRVLAAVAHVLGSDFRLYDLNSLTITPRGGYRQALHRDWLEEVAPGDFQACHSIWLVDEFTEENGATRVVPGTHIRGAAPAHVALADPSEPFFPELEERFASHPDEVRFVAPAGTVVVFNCHLWHSAMPNLSAHRRRACFAGYARRNQRQQNDLRAHVSQDVKARLTPAQRFLLDI